MVFPIDPKTAPFGWFPSAGLDLACAVNDDELKNLNLPAVVAAYLKRAAKQFKEVFIRKMQKFFGETKILRKIRERRERLKAKKEKQLALSPI